MTDAIVKNSSIARIILNMNLNLKQLVQLT